jgi:hypothetical protein
MVVIHTNRRGTKLGKGQDEVGELYWFLSFFFSLELDANMRMTDRAGLWTIQFTAAVIFLVHSPLNHIPFDLIGISLVDNKYLALCTIEFLKHRLPDNVSPSMEPLGE